MIRMKPDLRVAIITKSETRYMSVDIERDAAYGDTLTWSEHNKPKIAVQPVEIQVDLDSPRFNEMFVRLMSTPSRLAR
jgi:purine nucleosidase